MNHQKKSKIQVPESNDFRWRKVIHYFLIASILLIQMIIVGFFYNEFFNKKDSNFIERQIEELKTFENLTNDTKRELAKAQDDFQNFLLSNDEAYLKSYVESTTAFTKKLDKLNSYTVNNKKINDNLNRKDRDTALIKNLKGVLDTIQSNKTPIDGRPEIKFPNLKEFVLNENFDQYDIETQTFSDSTKKKGLFGRLKDAVTGNVDVRKDSTVVTMKKAENQKIEKLNQKLDSVVSAINRYYAKEIQKVQMVAVGSVNQFENQKNNDRNQKFDHYKIFSNLLKDSNDLIDSYEVAIQDSKTELQKEFDKQNSQRNKVRNYLVFAAMILMFIVSILIMFLTRIAFVYETKLNEANLQIKENLNFKNRILGMLSHELRSPLKIIDIFINRINKKTEDKSIKEYLKSISFTNKSLLMQASQILEYTKNQQVENKLVLAKFNLKEEINSILNSIKPYIESHDNTLIIHEQIPKDLEVYSDNTKINQIFMNILGNANKFTENGSIEVNISTESQKNNQIILNTIIKDTGVGISQSDLKNIFEPYYQGVLSEKVDNLGAGLGLSLCKQIVELYSGHISVSSELEKGTEVIFSLKLDKAGDY